MDVFWYNSVRNHAGTHVNSSQENKKKKGLCAAVAVQGSCGLLCEDFLDKDSL